jgi:hypothetical protein
VSTFLSKMERTWQVQPDMPHLILTLGMSSQEEIAWSLFAMYFSISWRDLYHGKVFLDDQRLRNTQTSKKRRRKLQLMNCAKVIQVVSPMFYTTAKNSVSLKILITNILSNNLSSVWKKTISTQLFLTSFGTKID